MSLRVYLVEDSPIAVERLRESMLEVLHDLSESTSDAANGSRAHAAAAKTRHVADPAHTRRLRKPAMLRIPRTRGRCENPP